MKKALSLLLAFAMVFSMFASVAFAADENLTTEQKYQWFVDKGVLKGYPDGNPRLGNNLTRAEFATIVVAIAGLEPKTDTETFSDVKRGQWWHGAIEAAAAEGLVQGVGGGRFDPRSNVTVEQVITVFVRLLGLKPVEGASVPGASEWAAGYVQAALDAGLITPQSDYKAPATRGQTIDLAYPAYQVVTIDVASYKVADDGKSIEFTLTNGDVVKHELTQALEANKETEITLTVTVNGVTKTITTKVTWVVEHLAVTGVTSDNLKNIVVTFNKPVNEKTVTSDTVKVYDGTTILGVTRYVSDDKRTVYLTHGANYDQMKEYKVVVNGVEAEGNASDKVTGVERTVKTQDVQAPSVVDLKVNSPKQIEITFSEPVNFPLSPQVLSQVQADGVSVFNSKNVDAKDFYTKNKVNLLLGTALAKGDHKIKVTGLKDFAGFPIEEKEFAVTIPDDTTPPKIVSARALSTTQIEIVFDEPVEESTVNGNTIKVDNVAIQSPSAKSDGKTFVVNLPSPGLSKGAIVDVVIKYKGVKDHYGNEVKEEQEFRFSVEDDTTLPTVTAEVRNNNVVRLTFSKGVQAVGGGTLTASMFELYDKDNKKVVNGIQSVVAQTVDGVTDRYFDVTLTNGNTLKGNYTLKILGGKIEDKTVRHNPLPETSLAIVLNDLVPPNVLSVELHNEGVNAGDLNGDGDLFDSQYTIYFDEPIDPATASNPNNYLIGGSYPGSDITITVSSDAKSVKLFKNNSNAGQQWVAGTPSSGASELKLLAIKDTAGNVLQGANFNTALNTRLFNPSVAWATAVSSVEATAKNTIKITADTGYVFKGVDPNKFRLVDTVANTLVNDVYVMSVSIASDGASATLTLSKDIESDIQYNGQSVALRVYDDAITLVNDVKTNDNAPTGINVIITDKIGPSVKEVKAISNNSFAIYFDENVKQKTGLDPKYDLIIRDLDNDNKQLSLSDYTVNISGSDNRVVVTLNTGVADGHRLSVELINGRTIVDTSATENAAAAFSAMTVKTADGSADFVFDT